MEGGRRGGGEGWMGREGGREGGRGWKEEKRKREREEEQRGKGGGYMLCKYTISTHNWSPIGSNWTSVVSSCDTTDVVHHLYSRYLTCCVLPRRPGGLLLHYESQLIGQKNRPLNDPQKRFLVS